MHDNIKRLAAEYLEQLEKIQPSYTKRIKEAIDDKDCTVFSIINAFERARINKTITLFTTSKTLESYQDFNTGCDEFVERARKIWQSIYSIQQGQESNIFDMLNNDAFIHANDFLKGKDRESLALTCRRFAIFFRNEGGITREAFRSSLLVSKYYTSNYRLPVLADGRIIGIRSSLLEDDVLFVVNSQNEQFITKLTLPKVSTRLFNIVCLSVLSDGQTIVASNTEGDLYIIKDIANPANIIHITKAHKNPIKEIAGISNQIFATCSHGKVIRLWDSAGNKVDELTATSSIGKLLVLSTDEIYCVGLLNDGSDNFILNINNKAFTPATRADYLFTINYSGIVGKAETNKYPHIHNFIGITCQLKLTDDQVIRGYKDGAMRIINLQTQGLVNELDPRKTAIFSMIFIAENLIATCAEKDKRIHITDIVTGKCIHVLTGHQKPVKVLVLLPNDKLASADDDFIHIWNIKSLVLQAKADANLAVESTNKSLVTLKK